MIDAPYAFIVAEGRVENQAKDGQPVCCGLASRALFLLAEALFVVYY
jgi:hypothetical protein